MVWRDPSRKAWFSRDIFGSKWKCCEIWWKNEIFVCTEFARSLRVKNISKWGRKQRRFVTFLYAIKQKSGLLFCCAGFTGLHFLSTVFSPTSLHILQAIFAFGGSPLSIRVAVRLPVFGSMLASNPLEL
jgi:hypothetical protein